MEALAVVIAIFISEDHFWLIQKEYAYVALGALACCLGVISTVKVTNRETNPRIYMHMTRTVGRFQYLEGKLIAIFLLDSSILLGIYLLAYKFTRLSVQMSFIESLIRMIPIVLVLMISIMITLLTSRLLTNKTYYYLLGASFIVLGFSQPSTKLSYVLPPIQQLIKGSFSKSLVDMKAEFLLALFYIVGLGVLTNLIFNKRELNYEQK
jgi:hypothetical protein